MIGIEQHMRSGPLALGRASPASKDSAGASRSDTVWSEVQLDAQHIIVQNVGFQRHVQSFSGFSDTFSGFYLIVWRHLPHTQLRSRTRQCV